MSADHAPASGPSPSCVSGAVDRGTAAPTGASRVATALQVLVLLSLCWLVFFDRLGEVPITNGDEMTHTRVAMGIADSGGWLQPRLRGGAYVQKPPLKLWLSALTFRHLGRGELFVRMWDAAFASATVLVTYALGRRMFGPLTGFVGAAVLALSPMYVLTHCARSGTQDSALVLLSTASLTAYWARDYGKRRWVIAGAVMGLASLTKVAMGLAPLSIATAHLLATEGWSGVRSRSYWVMAALAVGIPLLWFVPQSLLVPGTFETGVWANVAGRMAGTTLARHVEGPLYYLGLLWREHRPWAFALPFAIGTAVYASTQKPESKILLLLLWVTLPLVVFSAARTKLPWYIQPIFPALALLTAWFLVDGLRGLAAGPVHEGARPVLRAASATAIVVLVAIAIRDIRREIARPVERYPIQRLLAHLEARFASEYRIVLVTQDPNQDLEGVDWYYLWLQGDRSSVQPTLSEAIRWANAQARPTVLLAPLTSLTDTSPLSHPGALFVIRSTSRKPLVAAPVGFEPVALPLPALTGDDLSPPPGPTRKRRR